MSLYAGGDHNQDADYGALRGRGRRGAARYSRCESSFKKRTVNAKETKNSECQKVLSTTRYANSIKFYRLISVHRGAPVIIVFAVPIAARSCSLVLM